ncbi:NUDIX domain-containing protein [Desulfovibrio sp. OttesenSCG-928-C06]|nr:NUDIX domain-containing protein [Desulfovibrio sp. OttesenSCG-928-C06]
MRKNKSEHLFAIPDEEYLEVLDAEHAPLMLMPRRQALPQKLPLKVVLIVVRNNSGKIYIHKRSEKKSTYSGAWGVSAAGYVKAGESFEEAALRETAEELGVTNVHLKLAAMTEPTPDTDNSLVALFISNPAHLIITPDASEIAAGMFVDKDELDALMSDMSELLSPALKWAYSACDLFGV